MNQNPSTIGRLSHAFVNLPTWGLLSLTGVILGLAYPPNILGSIFGGVGLVPLIIALERTTTWKQTLRWSYLSFLIFSAITTWWVGSWQSNADPFLMISCVLLIFVHPFFFCVPMILYRALRKRTSLPIALAFLILLWTGGEYLHALTDASYPWLTLGNTQTYNFYYIQFIEYTGVWGLSLLMMIQNGVLAWLFLRSTEGASSAMQKRGGKIASALLSATLVLPYVHGAIVSGLASTTIKESEMTVTIVQPNQNPWDKWRKNDPIDHIEDNASLSFEALRSNEGRKTDMFLWAETAIPKPITHPDWRRDRDKLYRTLDSLGVVVMTGFPDYVVHASKEDASPSSRHDTVYNQKTGKTEVRYWDFYNSVGVFVPGKGLVDSYHKSQLVPFGERIPFVDLVPFLVDMLSWDVGISAWGKGSGPHAIDVPWGNRTVKSAGMVCFESVYPNMVRKFADDGAEFLTIVTNDGWYLGTPGPLQHERFAILRAIETRRSIARAANTGISCFVTPEGEIFGETKEGERTTSTGSIALRSDKTLYVRWGDWLPILSLIGAAAVALYGIVQTKKSRE
ncbi:MAG: apolipoprotein N-acyltransferase [Candidatus Kapaibacterium sp.]